MTLTLVRNKNGIEFDTRERCFITEILNDAKSPELSIARCRVLPGVTTELHSLSSTHEVYLIEDGSGLMDDGVCEPFVVSRGDSIIIPHDHPQRIQNTGNHDLIFTVTCTPRFRPECYTPLE